MGGGGYDVMKEWGRRGSGLEVKEVGVVVRCDERVGKMGSYFF